MTKLMAQVENLENQCEKNSDSLLKRKTRILQSGAAFRGLLYVIDVKLICQRLRKFTNQVPLGRRPCPPRETVNADIHASLDLMTSLVNCSSSFSVAATINNVPAKFLLDTAWICSHNFEEKHLGQA